MKVGSLCSGIGGIDLALESLGMETTWFVEYEKFCQTILKKHWPSTPIYVDLKKLTSSLPVSPANPSVSQVSNKESQTQGTSGPRFSEPSLIYDPLTRSLRTCQVSLLTNTLEPYSETYMKQGTMRNGVVFPRKKSELPTRENDFSFWPTATQDSVSQRKNRYKQGGRPLAMVAGNWRTPTEDDSSNVNPKPNRRPGLVSMVNDTIQNWPTPTTAEADKISNRPNHGQKGLSNHPMIVGQTTRPPMHESRAGDGLSTQPLPGPQAPQIQKDGPTSSSNGPVSHQQSNQVGSRKKLNPMFVEWLMGLEPSWTEVPG